MIIIWDLATGLPQPAPAASTDCSPANETETARYLGAKRTSSIPLAGLEPVGSGALVVSYTPAGRLSRMFAV